MVVGPFDRQDIGPFASSAALFQMFVKYLPREVHGRKQVVRCRRGSTSTHAIDVTEKNIKQTSSLSEYDSPIGTHFSQLKLSSHLIPTPILVLGYTPTAAPSSTMLDTATCPEIKFQDNLDQMYHFLQTLAGFSPVLHMDDESVPVSAPFQMPIHGSCSRCGQTPVFNPSVDDDDGQMPKQVHAPPQRSERLQLERDLSRERIH